MLSNMFFRNLGPRVVQQGLVATRALSTKSGAKVPVDSSKGDDSKNKFSDNKVAPGSSARTHLNFMGLSGPNDGTKYSGPTRPVNVHPDPKYSGKETIG